jgi:hypothetical protein
MASTYSTDLKIELMVTGENAGTWGDKTNTNWNVVQQAIAGYEAISIAGGSQTTALVMTNATISNARNAVVKLTGTITGNQIVTIPDGIEKTYIVENGTSGAFTVQFKTVSGTGPTFSTTDKGIKIVYSNGTNVVDVNANLSGPTLASDLDVNGKSIISTSNGNITLAPNGTGDVYLDADTVRIGDSNSNATLTTNGTGDLILNTNSGSNSGSITIADGTNGNISITPNGTGNVVLDGLNWPQADGSNGQVLQTNGSGQLAFGTISSSPTQLVQSLPLAGGVSYTAGQLASIGSSGNIIALPTVNTFGTARVNSSSLAYDAISTNGSRALRLSYESSGQLLRINGVAMTNDGSPVNGTVSVSDTMNFPGTSGSSAVTALFPLNETTFYVGFSSAGTTGCDEFGCGSSRNSNSFIVVVDASGNCTKGNVISNNRTGFNCGATITQAKVLKNLIVFQMVSCTQAAINQMHVFSGASTLTATSEADAASFLVSNSRNSFLTTNNKLVLLTGNTRRVSDYSASGPASIGTPTDTTIFGDYLSGGDFGRMSSTQDDAPEYILCTYTDTSAVSKYVTFSVNQTTGGLTQVETGSLSVINSNSPNGMTHRDKNRFIGTNASFSFTNGVANSPSFNAPYTLGVMRYNSDDLYFDIGTAATGFPQNKGYTVNAYATGSFNYIGVVKTTDSTSPIDIVTDGVVGGFTSLTPGTLYYAASPADGTVTTSSASGILVGKAVSATEILIIRGTN